MRSLAGAALVIVPLLSGTVTAQERARSVTLEPRGYDAYGSIAAVREMGGGRALVSDPDGRVLWAVTATGARSNAVRSGALEMPGTLRASRGDTTIAFDRMSGLFSIVTPEGTVLPAPASLSPPAGPRSIGIALDLYATDARGALYWAEPTRTESAPLWRRDAAGRAIAIASLRKPPLRQSGEGGIVVSMVVPFTPIDAWAVTDSGDVVIARGDPYRVDRVAMDGTITTGVPHAVPSVAVTTADREQARQRSRKSLGTVNLGGVAIAATLPDDAYPATKAPFGAGALRVSPDGSAWVHRAVALDSPNALVDVFQPGGSYRETVVLPRGAVLVGFGERIAFVSLPGASGDRVTLHTFAWR